MAPLQRILIAAAVLLAPVGASAQPKAPAQPQAPAPAKAPAPAPNPAKAAPGLHTFTLPNGLQVAVRETDPSSAPVIAVQLWYHVGSKDEARDRRGSAHMFEHMMFKGTKHVRAEGHAQFVSGVGGYVNAQTDEDATHYINTVPSAYLDFAIRLEAERMRNLLFRPEMIAIEREVVKEEIRQQENSPITKGFLRFLEIAYTKHPYAWTAGGAIKDLDATTPDDLRRFYDAHYQPGNALLVVVGRTTVAEVKAAAEKWFGAIPAAPSAKQPVPVEPPQTARRREVVEPGQIGLALVGYRLPPAKDKDIPALQVAAIVLGSGESSRLKVRLKSVDAKTKRPLALDGGMEALVREDPGMVIALGAYLDPSQGDPIETAIFEEVARLGAKGPTAGELRKAKNQVQSAFTFSLENVQGVAQAIGRSWIQIGDPSAFLREVPAIEKVTAADVMRVVKKYLNPDQATIVVIPPKAR